MAFLVVVLYLFVIAQAFSPIAHPTAPPTCRDASEIPLTATIAIQSHLSTLVNSSTFFSVFEVALEKSCPFWDEASMCVIRQCSVHNCTDAEVPAAWRKTCTSSSDVILNDVDRSRTGLAALVAHPWWLTADSAAWTVRDAHDETVFVDLRRNPERYTGYSGPSATHVWEAIYDENCFAFSSKCRTGICAPGTCKEERVLYRLISGLHTSISMHIAKDYLFPDSAWGVNTQIYKTRIRHFPERIANLNVAYALALRAVAKAAENLHPSNYSYLTGDDENDRSTREKLQDLFQFPQLQQRCQRRAFDESDMFLHEHHALLPEFRRAFRNISMIMDCVGCEKCRLWGKLQFLGLGTALRILFEPDVPVLERNDVIALFNLLNKLSSSVLWVDKMERIIAKEELRARIIQGGACLAVSFLLLFYFFPHPVMRRLRRDGDREDPYSGTRESEGREVVKSIPTDSASNVTHRVGRRKRASAG